MLTGGRSVRMGRDKSLIEVGGRALARIAADALGAAGAAEVFAVGGDAVALERLGLRVVPDGSPGEGPLGGIVTALEAATEDVVVVLACDLPRVTSDAVRAIVDALGDDGDVALPMVNGRSQHLLGAWRRPRVLEPLQRAFAQGERAIWRALAPLGVVPVVLGDPTWSQDVDDADALFRGPSEG